MVGVGSGKGSFEVLIFILLVTVLHPRRLDLDPLLPGGVVVFVSVVSVKA